MLLHQRQDGGFQTAEAEIEITATKHGTGKHEDGPAGLSGKIRRQVLERRSSWIAKSQQFRGFIEGFACCVVDGLAQ